MAEIEDKVVEAEVEDIGDEPQDADTTDWKAEAIKARGIAKRNATRLEKLKAMKVETTEPAKTVSKEGFDYAEKAFLKANDIRANEYDLVKEVMRATGKSLDEVLEAKYFQAELKERREQDASKDAIPSGSKRSAPAARDSVEYWIAKGQLPPADQKELRRKVVNSRIQAERSRSVFTDNPVV